ncbi:MAG: hypothetical protein HXY44_15085 [Syntrophaceae bacterium]|nr:hypothetical protein [Syntrophaceae bacterium]
MPSISNRNQSSFDPPIGIYTGSGASHSWLWFVEILERMGFYNIHFVDDRGLLASALDSLDVLLMSGGDTFAIAKGLGTEGSLKLRHFIEEGGLYIGTCAGAYLPLRSSMEFLNQFNFIQAKIANISRRLSEPERHSFQQVACSSYGCEFIFHVAREEVVVEMANGYHANGKKEMIAPLYGGPSIYPSEDIESIAIYKGFTKKTKFLVEKALAQKTLIGNIAVGKKEMGKGHLYIFGPHFEHPHFLPCNLFLIEVIRKKHGRRHSPNQKDVYEDPVKEEVVRNYIRDLKREVSHSRIAASGMTDFMGSWQIGNKYYDPEKIQVFIETLWKRFTYLESGGEVAVDLQDLDEMIGQMQGITDVLRKMKKGIDRGEATDGLAEGLFPSLKKVTSHFLTVYFNKKRLESIMSQA